jgi:hypothetical protein
LTDFEKPPLTAKGIRFRNAPETPDFHRSMRKLG